MYVYIYTYICILVYTYTYIIIIWYVRVCVYIYIITIHMYTIQTNTTCRWTCRIRFFYVCVCVSFMYVCVCVCVCVCVYLYKYNYTHTHTHCLQVDVSYQWMRFFCKDTCHPSSLRPQYTSSLRSHTRLAGGRVVSVDAFLLRRRRHTTKNGGRVWYSIFWVYWYKSTNTDAEGVRPRPCALGEQNADWRGQSYAGTQFTGFTGTKVQILTQKALPDRNYQAHHCQAPGCSRGCDRYPNEKKNEKKNIPLCRRSAW